MNINNITKEEFLILIDCLEIRIQEFENKDDMKVLLQKLLDIWDDEEEQNYNYL